MRNFRVGLGLGAIIAVLLSLALFLFGILNPLQTLSAILLLNGMWLIFFGVFFGEKRDRVYDGGWGVVIALLSTFYFIPLQDTIGLVLLGIIATILVYVFLKPKPAAGQL